MSKLNPMEQLNTHKEHRINKYVNTYEEEYLHWLSSKGEQDTKHNRFYYRNTVMALELSADPLSTPENHISIGEHVLVDNVIGCVGGVIQSDVNIGFHMLAFASVEASREQELTQETCDTIRDNIRKILQLCTDAPSSITLGGSYVDKNIGNFDLAYRVVAGLFREEVAKIWPHAPVEILVMRTKRFELG